MNLLSAPVLGASALLAGPALWAGLVTGQAPLEHALSRYGITVALVWLALSAVAMLIESTGPTLQPARVGTDGASAGSGGPAGAAGDTGGPASGA